MDDLLFRTQEYLLEKGYPFPGWRAGEEERAKFTAQVARALVEMGVKMPDEAIPAEAERLARMMAGLGVLDEVASEDGVEEVIVRKGYVLVEKKGVIEHKGRLADDAYFHRLAHKAADFGGRAMKADKPFVLVDLPDGSRFTAIIPPLSVEGTAINVRVFKKEAMTFADLTRTGTFEGVEEEEAQGEVNEEHFLEAMEEGNLDPLPPVAKFLATVARYNLATVLISGEFSSGKTTLLNAMSHYIPDTAILAVIETFRELKIAHPYPVRAVVPERGENDVPFPSMTEVVNVVYTRMRPDVIVFGEVVGPEAAPLLDAINLGKRVLTTIHGDSAYDALLRLETLALSSGLPLPAIQERIGRGIDLVVHLRRKGKWRYVEEVVAVEGYDRRKGRYRLVSLYRAEPKRERPELLEELWKRCEL